MTEKSEELQELERRIVTDINNTTPKNQFDEGAIAGMKCAWFELNNLDKPYQEGALND